MKYSLDIILLPNKTYFYPNILPLTKLQLVNPNDAVIVIANDDEIQCHLPKNYNIILLQRHEHTDEFIFHIIKYYQPKFIILYDCFWDTDIKLLTKHRRLCNICLVVQHGVFKCTWNMFTKKYSDIQTFIPRSLFSQSKLLLQQYNISYVVVYKDDETFA